jgi:hypothetical protein
MSATEYPFAAAKGWRRETLRSADTSCSYRNVVAADAVLLVLRIYGFDASELNSQC